MTTYMVNDVVVCDIMEEEAPLPAQEVPIRRRGSPTLEVPLALAIVWELDVGVLEVGDHRD